MKIWLLALLLIFPLRVLAWGAIGQAVTVKIAQAFLTEAAEKQLSVITDGKDLSELASWADYARRTPEWSRTSSWHYANIEKTFVSRQPQNILEALEFAENELAKSSTNEDKLVWIKFIIHFIGDIHQPLHTARSSDRGGNSLTVVFQGRRTNLHSLWDGVMIKELRPELNQYAQKIIDLGMDQELLFRKFDPLEVVSENTEILEFVYSFDSSEVGLQYADKALSITDKRLWAAGLRLASFFNQTFY